MDHTGFHTVFWGDSGYRHRLLHAPLQRPSKQIIDTIEYHLEKLDDLSVEELEVLKETTDTLIEHMERVKLKRSAQGK